VASMQGNTATTFLFCKPFICTKIIRQAATPDQSGLCTTHDEMRENSLITWVLEIPCVTARDLHKGNASAFGTLSASPSVMSSVSLQTNTVRAVDPVVDDARCDCAVAHNQEPGVPA
jgi:hypothetical protein